MKKLGLVVTVLLVLMPAVSATGNSDPFPGVSKGQEIPGTRVSSAPGESWESFNAGSGASHSCPAGSGRGMGTDLAGTVSQSDDVRYYYCVKTWEAPDTTSAWNDFNQRVSDAKSAAEAESRAWNAANPGKQKCVSWGPITDPNGGSQQGGVCANPVEVPAGSQTPSQSAGAVSEDDVADGVSGLPRTPSNPQDPTPGSSNSSVPRGSGYPFTQVLEGQLSTANCPAGFQAANGLIADATTKKQYTECWPQNAWTAYQLSGEAWSLFRATGGTYDPSVEVDRRAKVDLLIARAKDVAQQAALATPGIERCSSWSGFGQTGRECAYVFVDPATQRQEVENESTTDVVDSQSPNSPIDLGLDSVAVTGSSARIATFSLAITPVRSEANAIAGFARSFNAIRTLQTRSLVSLPTNKSLKFKVTSLTKSACTTSKSQVRLRNNGLCQLKVEITDSAGNTFEFVKKLRRK